jgi:hypothetical protein
MINLPAEWIDDADPVNTRAFYELMQVYRHADFASAAEAFETVKQFIREAYSSGQE